MKNKSKKELLPLEYSNLAKHNIFIGAKYKASLLELRTTYASLYMIQIGAYREEPDGIYVEMKANQLKTIIGANSSSFYSSLKPVAKSMMSRRMGIDSRQKQSFHFINLVNEASYKNGVFTVVFNKKLSNFMINLQKEYTSLPRNYMMSLNSTYSFRLYEILKKGCFYRKDYVGNRDGKFSILISLAELKLDIGVVNSNLDCVQRVLDADTQPNYEKAVEVSPEKLYEEWSDFKKRCLDEPIEEINEKTDIKISYNVCGAGNGGKVYAIQFNVYYSKLDDGAVDNELENREDIIELTEDEKLDILFDVRTLITGLKTKDARSICEAANYDFDKIKKEFEIMQKQKAPDNIVGWLISAIKNDYEESNIIIESPKKKSKTKKNEFNNFEQRYLDFDDLESKLLSN